MSAGVVSMATVVETRRWMIDRMALSVVVTRRVRGIMK